MRLGHQKATRNVHSRDAHRSLKESGAQQDVMDEMDEMDDFKGPKVSKSWILAVFWFQITGELGQELKTQSGGIWQFCRLQLDQHLEAQKIDCLVVRLNHLEK